MASLHGAPPLTGDPDSVGEKGAHYIAEEKKKKQQQLKAAAATSPKSQQEENKCN